MSIFIALLLGLVQGLCEFLPVSSSGHLVLLNNLFGIEEGALFFAILLHVGTVIALFAVYWRDIWAMLRRPFQKKVGMLLIACIPAGVMAALFNDFFTETYSGVYLGFGFLLTAVILLFAQYKRPGKTTMETMGVMDALVIGFMQGVAILPGVSRSGSTIAGALFSGLKKKEAADFSFLLSIPAILGSVMFEVPDLLEKGVGDINVAAVIVGVTAAALAGYFAIKLMLRVVTDKKLTPFAVYVGILGLLVLFDQFVTNAFFVRPF